MKKRLLNAIYGSCQEIDSCVSQLKRSEEARNYSELGCDEPCTTEYEVNRREESGGNIFGARDDLVAWMMVPYEAHANTQRPGMVSRELENPDLNFNF